MNRFKYFSNGDAGSRRNSIVRALGCVSLAIVLSLAPAAAALAGTKLDVKAISEAAGTHARVQADGVVKIGWSRDDVAVTVDGMPLPSAAGLGSWAAFKMMPDGGAMVMGDTVVLTDEIDAAMDAAFSHGLQVTALHNHFAYDHPPVFFMHLMGRGDPLTLAKDIRAVWAAIRAVRRAHPLPLATSGVVIPRPGHLDADRIGRIVGLPARRHGSVVKVAVGRTARMDGVEIGASMGLTTWAAFSGDDKLASIDGDFLMHADEVQPVLRALRTGGIHVAALHTHMIGERPVAYFAHYWGVGPAAKLAQVFRSALDAQRHADER